ncbi:MAG: hypothetical protein ACPL7E_00115 [bacterium]
MLGAILSLQAYGQTIELSPAQMEETKGGLWKMCDKVHNCGQPCLNDSILNKSYEVKPVNHYVCGISLCPANCSDFASLICGEVWTYVGLNCQSGGYHEPGANYTDKGCGLYP